MPTDVSPPQIKAILGDTRTIAVLGMKAPGYAAAYTVPKYMERQGYAIIPVNPNHDTIDGAQVYETVDAIDEPVDMVNVFRRPEHIAPHVDEILAMDPLPKVVWFQLGIRNDAAAERLEEAGITVVQDRCLKVAHARMG